MAYTGIYKIQSKIKPEKVYLGSAINIDRRWGEHLRRLRGKRHGNSRLQNHCNKYGVNDLQFSVVLECSKTDLIVIEQQFLDDCKPFFNICKTASSQLGMKRSKETRKKMSDAKKNVPLSKDHKAGLRKYWHNRPAWTDETLKKRSESMKKFMKETGFMPPLRKGCKKLKKNNINT